LRETEALEEDLPAEFNGLDWLVAALFRAAEEMLWELEVAERRTLCEEANTLDFSSKIELVVEAFVRVFWRLDGLCTVELCCDGKMLDFPEENRGVPDALSNDFMLLDRTCTTEVWLRRDVKALDCSRETSGVEVALASELKRLDSPADNFEVGTTTKDDPCEDLEMLDPANRLEAAEDVLSTKPEEPTWLDKGARVECTIGRTLCIDCKVLEPAGESEVAEDTFFIELKVRDRLGDRPVRAPVEASWLEVADSDVLEPAADRVFEIALFDDKARLEGATEEILFKEDCAGGTEATEESSLSRTLEGADCDSDLGSVGAFDLPAIMVEERSVLFRERIALDFCREIELDIWITLCLELAVLDSLCIMDVVGSDAEFPELDVEAWPVIADAALLGIIDLDCRLWTIVFVEGWGPEDLRVWCSEVWLMCIIFGSTEDRLSVTLLSGELLIECRMERTTVVLIWDSVARLEWAEATCETLLAMGETTDSESLEELEGLGWNEDSLVVTVTVWLDDVKSPECDLVELKFGRFDVEPTRDASLDFDEATAKEDREDGILIASCNDEDLGVLVGVDFEEAGTDEEALDEERPVVKEIEERCVIDNGEEIPDEGGSSVDRSVLDVDLPETDKPPADNEADWWSRTDETLDTLDRAPAEILVGRFVSVFGALKSDDGVGCPLGRDKDLAGTFVGSAVFDFRGSMSDEDSDSTVWEILEDFPGIEADWAKLEPACPGIDDGCSFAVACRDPVGSRPEEALGGTDLEDILLIGSALTRCDLSPDSKLRDDVFPKPPGVVRGWVASIDLRSELTDRDLEIWDSAGWLSLIVVWAGGKGRGVFPGRPLSGLLEFWGRPPP
jgi:hypothetical protein